MIPSLRLARARSLAPRALLVTLGLVGTTLTLVPRAAHTQERDREDHARVRNGLAIGDVPRVNGLRLNFRDYDLELVRGMNVTIWAPYDDAYEGTVRGIALGLPATGAGEIRGLAVAPFFVGANREIAGVTLAGLGAGSGGDISGISVAGLGFGTGGDLRGFTVGGLGAGAGGDARGITVGGLGAGVGGNVRGLMVGGLGAGAGGNARGFLVGGLGVGAGGDLRGITIAGIGAGAGGDVAGLTIAGIGVGAGGTLRGFTVAGIAVGAPELRGAVIAAAVGTEHSRAVVVAPILFRTERHGSARGLNISAVNAVRGFQGGLALGIVNYAEELDGLQLGLVNIVRRNPAGRRVLPILNYGDAR